MSLQITFCVFPKSVWVQIHYWQTTCIVLKNISILSPFTKKWLRNSKKTFIVFFAAYWIMTKIFSIHTVIMYCKRLTSIISYKRHTSLVFILIKRLSDLPFDNIAFLTDWQIIPTDNIYYLSVVSGLRLFALRLSASKRRNHTIPPHFLQFFHFLQFSANFVFFVDLPVRLKLAVHVQAFHKLIKRCLPFLRPLIHTCVL